MAKLTSHEKTLFATYSKEMKVGEYAFRFDRDSGRSYMAVFTGPMKTHYAITIAHCGKNDIFKKKLGFIQCCDNLANDSVLVMPTSGMCIDDCVLDFIEHNFPDDFAVAL